MRILLPIYPPSLDIHNNCGDVQTIATAEPKLTICIDRRPGLTPLLFPIGVEWLPHLISVQFAGIKDIIAGLSGSKLDADCGSLFDAD
jgi:hypothetical protein